jgi:hypothetical protein
MPKKLETGKRIATGYLDLWFSGVQESYPILNINTAFGSGSVT